MEFYVTLYTGIFFGLVTLAGVVFGIWQNRQTSHIKKAVNDNVKGLFKDATQIIIMAKNEKDHREIAERGRKIRDNIVRLDIINRNLDYKKINKLEDEGFMGQSEAERYKRLCSN